MRQERVLINADHGHYLLFGRDLDFDAGAAVALNDGVLGPGVVGVTVITGAQHGPADAVVTVLDGPLRLPRAETVVAAACNLLLPTGRLSITDWFTAAVFEHDFGRPLVCAVLVEVEGRDEAAERTEIAPPYERNCLTISPVPLDGGRWRSSRSDATAGHVAQLADPTGSPAPALPDIDPTGTLFGGHAPPLVDGRSQPLPRRTAD